MSRRHEHRVPVHLSTGISPTPEERDAILRAADELIAQGGRSLLVRVLRGSKSVEVLEHKLDACPAYGRPAHLGEEAVLARVDYLLSHGWLRYEYFHRLPLLVHSPLGWERVKEIWQGELLDRFSTWVRAGTPEKVWPALQETNREITLPLLDRIAADGRTDLLPVLEAWRAPEVKKMRAAIGRAIARLRGAEHFEPTQADQRRELEFVKQEAERLGYRLVPRPGNGTGSGD